MTYTLLCAMTRGVKAAAKYEALLPSWLKTPETHPGHHTVGHFYVDFWHGWVYYCDSYDDRAGYWMWPIMRAPERKDQTVGARRTNVSTNAIGRTWHEVHEFNNPKLLTILRERLEVLKQDPEFINRHQGQGDY